MKNLFQILPQIIERERRLKQVYQRLDNLLMDETATFMSQCIRTRVETIFQMFDQLNLEDFREAEFIRSLPESFLDESFPALGQGSDAGAGEVVSQLLVCEEQVATYYEKVRRSLIYIRSKDIFDMLVHFKQEQLHSLRELQRHMISRPSAPASRPEKFIETE